MKDTEGAEITPQRVMASHFKQDWDAVYNAWVSYRNGALLVERGEDASPPESEVWAVTFGEPGQLDTRDVELEKLRSEVRTLTELKEILVRHVPPSVLLSIGRGE